jgi:RimJ/RimL family protein N-acetyltransferase
MNKWTDHPLSLKGQVVELLPLEASHFESLYAVANEKGIWQFLPRDGSDRSTFFELYDEALAERASGNQYPFIIRHNLTGNFIGSTRFLDIQPTHKKLEIGWTWLHPDYWGTVVNFECKYLLLTHCFESLKAVRVQIKTSDSNLRSRRAIEKIGAKFEGILRKDRIRENGTTRNSAYYSIIDEEWEQVKQKLSEIINARQDSQQTK